MDANTGGNPANPADKPSSAPGNKADGVFRAPVPPPMPGMKKREVISPKPIPKPFPDKPVVEKVSQLRPKASLGEASIKYQVSDNEPEGSDDVVIHTMQDDLAGKSAPAAPVPITLPSSGAQSLAPEAKPVLPIALPTIPVPPRKLPAEKPVSPPIAGQTPASYPLPPRGDKKADPIVVAPSKSKGRAGKVFLTLFILLFLLGGGGFAAWYFLLKPSAEPIDTLTEDLVADSSLILPDETSLIIQYNLDSATARAAALDAWRATAGTTNESTLSGNPTRLIEDPELSQLFYVVLEDEGRPFLVVPKTSQTSDLFAGGVAVLEKNGWLIVHPVSTAAYEAALTRGTRANQTTQPDIFHTAEAGALRLEIGLAGLIDARRSLISEDFAIGQLLAATLSGPLSRSQVQLSGVGEIIAPPVTGPLFSEALLSRIPATAEVIRLGASLKEDVERWLSAAAVLNTEALASPQVQQLLAEFDTPYAFFSYKNPVGGLELGLVAELPEGTTQLTLGDAALETALTAVTPLVAERINPSLLAFADGAYQGIPLRFVNLGETGAALDYAIHENTLLVGTSKSGMFALLDAAAAQQSVALSPAWADLFAAWGALPQGRDLVAARSLPPDIARLLPGSNSDPAQFGVVFTPTPNGLAAEGLITWDTSADTIPAVTPSP